MAQATGVIKVSPAIEVGVCRRKQDRFSGHMVKSQSGSLRIPGGKKSRPPHSEGEWEVIQGSTKGEKP